MQIIMGICYNTRLNMLTVGYEYDFGAILMLLIDIVYNPQKENITV